MSNAVLEMRTHKSWRFPLWASVMAFTGLCLALYPLMPAWLVDVPAAVVFPIAQWTGDAIEWFAREAGIGAFKVQDLTRLAAKFIDAPISFLNALLSEGYSTGAGFNKQQLLPPLSWFGVTGTAVLVAWRLSGPRLTLMIIFGGMYLVSFGLWPQTMTTLASVALCVVIAAAAGLGLGVASYRSARTETVARAVMNVMQTVPIFSYLIPTLLLFGYGPSAALFATVVYALPPMVHATVLALRSVPEETREFGAIAGCTRRQILWKIELPVALPNLAIGLNQVVMMSLNMVIIASMIGAGGLGYDVLRALRRLDIGAGLQAGLAIVVLAVILDRLTQDAAHVQSTGKRNPFSRADVPAMLAILGGATALSFVFPQLANWPEEWTLTTAPFWNDAVSYINKNFFDQLEALRTFMLLFVMNPLRDFMLAVPWAVVLASVGLLGFVFGRARLALTLVALLLFIVLSGYWDKAMGSVYLIALSVMLALAAGVPLGVWIAARPRLRKTAGLALDTLQTLPTLVYLLPAVMLFRNGDFSALIAVTLYALAPMVRYTIHGFSNVPADRLEAADMCGCTAFQRFVHVKLPAAAPTLILGVNQTIMMALSMLVIAALVGTRELGQEVFIALSQGNTGDGIVAGLCVAALALAADGLLKAWSTQAVRGVTNGRGARGNS
ncbi:MAG: ABC transporter permease subunit [Pseudomonadota bacterium]